MLSLTTFTSLILRLERYFSAVVWVVWNQNRTDTASRASLLRKFPLSINCVTPNKMKFYDTGLKCTPNYRGRSWWLINLLYSICSLPYSLTSYQVSRRKPKPTLPGLNVLSFYDTYWVGWPGEGTPPRIGLAIDGLIDGLQILSVAPSAEDIQRGMNGGIQLALPNPQRRWRQHGGG